MFTALALAITAQVSGTQLLLVDLDDVGFDLLRDTPTPNLDWLEANGRFYTNFTTAPVCSPTRAMVHTGAFPSNLDLLLGATVTSGIPYVMPLAPLEPLASVLLGAGNTTGKIGKWHLAPNGNLNHVLNAGFMTYAGVLGNLSTSGMTTNYLSYPKTINGVAQGTVTGRYLTTDEADDTIRLLKARVNFVSVSFHAPHAPFHIPPPHLHTISPIVDRRDRARAALQACDTELGRVLGVAIAEGYPIIIFGDNGTPQPAGGQKGTLYEGGINTPMWAYSPPGAAQAFAQGVDDTLLTAADIYDTVLDHFGLDATLPTRGPNSNSFQSSLQGSPAYRRWAYSERFPGNGNDPRGTFGWRQALRTDRYKLIRNQDGQGDSLYDLTLDPNEANDLLTGAPLSASVQAALDFLVAVMATI